MLKGESQRQKQVNQTTGMPEIREFIKDAEDRISMVKGGTPYAKYVEDFQV